MLEKHIHSLILSHLKDFHPLSDCQWGFRPGHSTVTALLSTIHEWLQLLEAGMDICAVFLDYRKAFDSVPHAPLIGKLVDIDRVLYTDDALLYQPISHPDDFLTVQSDINTVKGWSDEHLLQLNPPKCKYMILSKKKSPVQNGHTLSLGSSVLEEVETFKYTSVCSSRKICLGPTTSPEYAAR